MTIAEDMQRRYIGKRVRARDNTDIVGYIYDMAFSTQVDVLIKINNDMHGRIPFHLAEIIPDTLPLPG